jgi:hypothetical protein
MKDYGIVIPVYTNEKNVHMVDRCIEMLDIDPDRVLIINNNKEPICKRYEGRGFKILYPTEELGCSRAWNLGLKEGHDWTFIVSCQMRFPEGFSAIAQMLEESQSDKIFWTPQGWHLVAINKKVVEAIGYFDENFYPAYMEDSDYMRRLSLAGIDLGGYHDIPTYCQKTSQAMSSGATTNPARSTAYWIKKWGNEDMGNPKFDKPFGDKPLNYWPERTIKQIIDEWENR